MILWATDIHLKFSNLAITQGLFNTILRIVEERKIREIVLTGDINDTKAIIRSECLNQLRKFCTKLRGLDCQVYVLVGNHDMHNAKSMEFGHSLESLKDLMNVTVFDTPTTHAVGGKRVKFLPYTEDNKLLMKELKNEEKAEFLFCHNGISGAAMNSKGMFDDFSISTSKYKNFKRVFVGHYHAYQELENIIYLGSPFSHSFAESNTKKYIGIIDMNTGNVELVEPGLRGHYDYDVKSAGIIKYNKFNVHPERTNEDLVRVFLYGTKEDNKKAYSIIHKTPNMKFIFKNEDRTEERIKIDPGEARETLLGKYVEKVNTTLDKGKLSDIGKEILKNADL